LPGNVRELTNIVQRAAWLAVGGLIDAADLDINIPADAAQADAISQPARAGSGAGVGLDHDLKERERKLILPPCESPAGSRKLRPNARHQSANARHKLRS